MKLKVKYLVAIIFLAHIWQWIVMLPLIKEYYFG